MSDALLQSIEANPTDRSHRLVYSDFLQENDPQLAACFDADLAFAETPDDPSWQALASAIRGVDPLWAKRALHRYDLWLQRRPERLIMCIKIWRTLTGQSLREAKEHCERTPAIMAADLDGAQVEALRRHMLAEIHGDLAVVPADLSAERHRLPPSPYRMSVALVSEQPGELVGRVLGLGTKAAEALGLEVAPQLDALDAIVLCERFAALGVEARMHDTRYRRIDH